MKNPKEKLIPKNEVEMSATDTTEAIEIKHTKLKVKDIKPEVKKEAPEVRSNPVMSFVFPNDEDLDIFREAMSDTALYYTIKGCLMVMLPEKGTVTVRKIKVDGSGTTNLHVKLVDGTPVCVQLYLSQNHHYHLGKEAGSWKEDPEYNPLSYRSFRDPAQEFFILMRKDGERGAEMLILKYDDN